VKATTARQSIPKQDGKLLKGAKSSMTDAALIEALRWMAPMMLASARGVSTELWQEVIALNLSSVFFATKAALPHLGHGARIVNVSSVAARHGGGPGAFAYAAAKGGVMTLTRGLAKELASRNIRVNAIAPGVIETPFHDKFSTPELLETFRKSIPLGRLGTPDECAGAILYLVSPLASYVTGQTIDINGGQWFA
jgi:3-oxoacyl-[acyl-carrier protein] reductase